MKIEFCKNIKDRGNIVEYGTIQPTPRDYECYISLFPFDNGIDDYIKRKGTISGYDGVHYAPYICFDIDVDGDLETAKKSTIQLIDELAKKDVRSDELYIFFSGNKGYHVVMTEHIYGKLSPSKDIAKTIKGWVKLNFGHIVGIDTVIYEPHRLIRVSNSRHPKSGLYKVPITFKELSGSDIQELAKEPRTIDHIKATEIRQNTIIRNELLTPIREETKHVHTSGFFTPANKGNRNQHYFEQASHLFSKTELSHGSILEILRSINSASQEPVSDKEVELLVTSASKYRNGKEDISYSTFAQAIPEWVDYHSDESRKITIGLEKLDKEFKGKLRGKLGLFVGYGGSKKSLLAQNICFNNLNSGCRSLYSNMEMGQSQLMDRLLSMIIEDAEINGSIEMQRYLKSDPENAIKYLSENVAPVFSDKVLMCQNGSLKKEDYKALIQKAENEVGTVDILAVDGLSMMGGNGTENEVYTKNSKELKDLAKEHNIFVVLIAHASRGETETTRSLIRNIRGSEKIMDNCDFVVTLSRVMNGKDYNNEFGVYNCWNKRGSGNTIEQVFQFNQKRLYMSDYDGELSDVVPIDNTY